MKPLKIAKNSPYGIKCCCSCVHAKRIKDRFNMFDHCECDIDGMYIGYAEAFSCVCDDWRRTDELRIR